MPEPLIIPAGRKTGCNLRVSKYGDIAPLAPERIDIIPRERWGELIGNTNLREFVPIVLDQDGVGSCATESSTSSIHITRAVQRLEFVQLNPWSIYHFTSHGRDAGSSIDENLVHIRDIGILPESYWPRSKGWRASPPDGYKAVAALYRLTEFFELGSVEEVGSACLAGIPVVMGWQGHSVLLTRLLSPTVAEYLNSWSPEWGDNGYGQIKLDNINFGYGAFGALAAVYPK